MYIVHTYLYINTYLTYIHLYLVLSFVVSPTAVFTVFFFPLLWFLFNFFVFLLFLFFTFVFYFWCAQKAGKLHFIYALFWRFKLSERRSLCDFLFYFFFLSWRFHFQFRCCACAVEWGKSCINLFLYSTNIG